MTERSWKREERWQAAFWGGKRNALSGKASGHTSADVRGLEGVFVEVKQMSNPPLLCEFSRLAVLARKVGKPPLLVLEAEKDPKVFVMSMSSARALGCFGLLSESNAWWTVFASFLVEHVVKRRQPYQGLYVRTSRLAAKEGKEPVVCVHAKGTRTRMAIVGASWFRGGFVPMRVDRVPEASGTEVRAEHP